MNSKLKGRLILGVALLVWLAAVGGGAAAMWRYASAAGPGAQSPVVWPTDARVNRASGRWTLVMFVHPKCPCSRASLGELDRVVARTGKAADVAVLFVKPTGVGEDWTQTDLWRSAAAIPGVRVAIDDGGVEAARFNAATSGHVALYDGAGALRFSGGITSGRGHAGDNDGEDSIRELIQTGDSRIRQTSVFGCSLGDLSVQVCEKGEQCRH